MPIYIPRALNTGTCIKSRWRHCRVTCLDLRVHTGTCAGHSQHRKNSGEALEKNEGEWTGKVTISQEEIPGSRRCVACLAINWPTPGVKGTTFEPWVLSRWDLNFCVSSSPMRAWGRGWGRGHMRPIHKSSIHKWKSGSLFALHVTLYLKRIEKIQLNESQRQKLEW